MRVAMTEAEVQTVETVAGCQELGWAAARVDPKAAIFE